MPERVLITGGAGYIGSILTPALLSEGYHVTVLDAFRFGQASLLECCAHPNFEVIHGDCRDEKTLREALRGADYIFPLAAIVGAPACKEDAVAASTLNLDAVKLLLSLRSAEQRVIFPCTNSGYGIGEAGAFCTEESPLRPLTLYGTSKVEAEAAVLDAGNSASLRLATVFGVSPRMRLDLLVNDFVHRAVTDRALVIFEGHFKRNYIHIRDVARAFLHLMRNFESMKGRPYNVGLSDANLSKIELCEKIKQAIPGFVYMEAAIGEDPDKRDYIVSNARIEATGYKPEYSIEMGICELQKAFRILRARRYSNV
jgi:nucleoside-diphosphate-sugar epimerase